MTLRRYLVSTALILVLSVLSGAQSVRAGIAYDGRIYRQDFDTLANAPEGSTPAWIDDTTIPGWFSDESTYTVENGTSTAGRLYSFGSEGDPDRALGSIASSGTGIVFYGAEFINNTDALINEFRLTYFGEQWRRTNAVANTLEFGYSTTANFVTSTSAFTRVTDLDFSALESDATGSLDGNLSSNRSQISALVSIDGGWDVGESLWIRWRDPNDSGFDQGLGVDDLVFSTPGAVPEPATLAIFSPLCLAFLRRRRNARR